MAWTTPGTATAGEVLTAAFWNSNVRDNLQVVRSLTNVQQAVSSTTTSTNSTTFADISGLSVSITPTFNTSKILVIVSVNANVTSSYSGYFRLMRDSTAIGIGTGTLGNRTACTFEISGTYAYGIDTGGGVFIDSPATTSSTTYKLQWAVGNPASTAYLNRTSDDFDASTRGRSISSITVQEIPI